MIHRVPPFAALLLLLAPALAQAQPDPLADEGQPQVEPPPSPAAPGDQDVAAGDGEAPADSLEAEQQAAERAQARQDNRAANGETVAEGEVSYSHDGQFYLRAGIALPFIFAVKYGEGPICSHEITDEGEAETLCRRVGEPLLDLDLGFAVTDSVELSLLGRFGLTEQDLTESRQVILGLGVRSYGSPMSQVKAYIGARLIAELTVNRDLCPVGSPICVGDDDWGDVDIGGRGEGGLSIDAMRQLGFYLQLGATFQLLRGFYLIGDVSAGVQVRIP